MNRIQAKAIVARFNAKATKFAPIAAASGFLALAGSSVAHAVDPVVTVPDYSGLVTAGSSYATTLVTTYGAGLLLIALTFRGWNWVSNKVAGKMH